MTAELTDAAVRADEDDDHPPAWWHPVTRVLPEIAAILLVICWGSSYIIAKDAYEHITPMSYIFARYLTASLLGLAILWWRGRRGGMHTYWYIHPEDRWRFIWCGLMGFTLNQLLFSYGVDLTSAFASSLLGSLIPLFSLALVTMLGERQARVVWIGVIVAVIGVTLFLARGGEGMGMLGNVLCLGAAASFAIYSELARPLVRRYPGETVATYTMAIGSLPLFFITMPDVLAQDWASLDPMLFVVILYIVIFPIYLSLMVWNWIIAKRGVAATGWNLVVPIASGIMAVLFLGDTIGVLQIIGAIVTLLGLVLMQRDTLRRGRPAPGDA